MSPTSIPRKALKANIFSTPGKSTIGGGANLIPEDVFTSQTTVTPMTPSLYSTYDLPSPANTPTTLCFKDSGSLGGPGLATELLQVFDRKNIRLSSDVKKEVRAIAEKHDRHLRGVFKGRDISRAVIAAKSGEIMKLKEKVAALEAERQILKESVEM